MPEWLRTPDARELTDGVRQRLTSSVPAVPLLVFDNVAEHFVDEVESGQRTGTYDLQREYPCLAAPFGEFWVEARAPAGALMAGIQRWGALVTATDYAEWDPADRGQRADVLGYNPRWQLLGLAVYDRAGEGPTPLMADWICHLGEDGRLLGRPKWVTYPGIGKRVNQDDLDEFVGEIAQVLLLPLLAGICYLHCTNVRVVDHPSLRLPPRPDHRRGPTRPGRRTLRYSTIEVAPGLAPSAARGLPADEIDGGVALHLARGHFKDYRTGGGLFGKQHGMWWSGPTLRGDPVRGVVVSDYDVSPGDPA
jgi:hypothetical protein